MSEDAATSESTASVEKSPQTDFKPLSAEEIQVQPFLAPPLPPYFVPRAELYTLKELILGRPTASLAPLTLHGHGGSGKSSLALALAHDADLLEAFPDGVLWYSLGEEGNVQHAQAVWAEALGLDLSQIPDTTARASALRTRLRDSRSMLIIDDVTDAEQVKALNVGGPNCVRLITTDRIDEVSYAFKTRRFAINRLAELEALSLLTEWAGLLPDIYIPTVKEIIARLIGSALTLSLVGAQARQGITWLRLLEVLRDDQGPLASLSDEEDETRRKAMGLVLNLVMSRFGSAQLQRATLLAAFAPDISAPFSIDAAAACWEVEREEARSIIKALVEASLVQRLPGEYFALHRELEIQLKATARPGIVEQAQERVNSYYLTLVTEQAAAGSAIDHQLGQIMASYKEIVRDRPEQAAPFADGLMHLFENRSLWSNFVVMAEVMVEQARESEDLPREDDYLGDLGYAHTVLGNFDQALQCYQRSLAITRQLGDPAMEANSLNNVGALYERLGDYASAREHYEQSLELREMMGAPDDIADALNNLAGVLYWQESWDDALNAFQRVLDIFTVQSDRSGQAQTWLNIGAVYENLAKDVEAQQAYTRSLAIYTNLNHEAGQAQALNNLGIIYFNVGDTERALSHFKRSLALKEKLGDRPGAGSSLNNIALLYENTGSLSLALDTYERAYHIFDSLEDPRAAVVQENIAVLKEKVKK